MQHDLCLASRAKRIYANAHTYHINSISVNSDQQTFLSADDLRINLWNLDVTDQSFNIVDIKPPNMDDLTEVRAAPRLARCWDVWLELMACGLPAQCRTAVMCSDTDSYMCMLESAGELAQAAQHWLTLEHSCADRSLPFCCVPCAMLCAGHHLC
jgi:hypothetical protein